MVNPARSCKLIIRGSEKSKLTLQDSVKAHLLCSYETLDPMSQQCFFGTDFGLTDVTAFQRLKSLGGFLNLQVEERNRLFERIADSHMVGSIADTVVPVETANPMLSSWWIMLDLDADRTDKLAVSDTASDSAWASTDGTYCEPDSSQVGSGGWKPFLACSGSSTGFLRTQPVITDTWPKFISDTDVLDLRSPVHYETIDWKGCPEASQGRLSKAIGAALRNCYQTRRWQAELKATGTTRIDIAKWIQSNPMHV